MRPLETTNDHKASDHKANEHKANEHKERVLHGS